MYRKEAFLPRGFQHPRSNEIKNKATELLEPPRTLNQSFFTAYVPKGFPKFKKSSFCRYQKKKFTEISLVAYIIGLIWLKA